MTLGQKIKFYRQKQKIGQEHLAQLSHISVSTIRKYESDERRPKKEQLEKLAHALHISPAALKDYSYDSVIDALPALFAIGKIGDIQFIADKNEDGVYNSDTFAIRFNNAELMDFLMDWAYKKEEVDSVKEAIAVVRDEASQKMMQKRLNELSSEIENKLVLERISDQIYFEEGLPKQPLSKSIIKDTPQLKKYSQFIDVLYRMAKVIKFDCVGVWEKMWEAKAIFTFEEELVKPENMTSIANELFDKFLFYYSEFKRLGTETDGYAFVQGGRKYYRYIIKDRSVATSISIINDTLSFPWETADEYDR